MKPKISPIYCSRCGKEVGTVPGVVVTPGVVCTDPICQYQPEITINEKRDALIIACVRDGIPVNKIALASGVSRQRVYQIVGGQA